LRSSLLARPVALLALLPLCAAGRAGAAGLEISPVTVSLSPGETSALISVRNAEASEVRLQVTSMTWGETAEGEMKLAPTKDLVVFPALLVLKAGEQRSIRVGAGAGFGPVERDYRIFVEELPPAERSGAPNSVRVLSRIGIPVFLAPSRVERRPVIEDLVAAQGRIGFALRNRGTVHFRPAVLKIMAVDAGGKELFQHSWNPWYVLPGGERRYQEPLPAAICALVRKVTVEASDEEDHAKATRETPDGACAR